MAATIDNIEVKNTTITTIEEQDHRLPLLNIQLIFQVSGSIQDGKKPGLAKLCAKMLGEGTKKLGSSKFAEKLATDAIHLSAHAGVETFVVELSALKEKQNEALKRLHELLSDPNLTQETLQKVKTKILGKLQAKEDDFDYIADKNLKKILFENTPLANPRDGTPKSIASISLEDVKNFLTTHLVLSRAIVAIGGDFDKTLKYKIADTIKVLPKGKSATLPFYEASNKQKETIEKKETKQAYIYFGAPFFMRVSNEELYKAKVAAFILGSGGFGSRLMEIIRVKHGLAYSAYSRINVNKSHSYFSGYMQTKLDSQKQALQLTKKTIHDFVTKGATKEELEQTKKFLLGSEPLRNETMNQRLNRAFMEYYRGYQPGHYKKELQNIASLSLEDLNKFIQKHKEIEQISVSIVTK